MKKILFSFIVLALVGSLGVIVLCSWLSHRLMIADATALVDGDLLYFAERVESRMRSGTSGDSPFDGLAAEATWSTESLKLVHEGRMGVLGYEQYRCVYYFSSPPTGLDVSKMLQMWKERQFRDYSEVFDKKLVVVRSIDRPQAASRTERGTVHSPVEAWDGEE